MFDRILVPLDRSERAESVLASLGAILSVENTEIHLLGVSVYEPIEGKTLEEAMAAADALVETYLEGVAARLEQKGLTVHSHRRRGRAADTILDFAAENEIDLVAMASHGRSGWSRLVRGSVAETVLRNSTCPVLMFKSLQGRNQEADPNAEILIGPARIEHLLVPLDGSPDSEKAVPAAYHLAELFGAKLHVARVLTVVPLEGLYPVGNTLADASLIKTYVDDVASGAAEKGVDTESVVLSGQPAAAILEYLERHPVDMLVMSTHGYSGVRRWLLGSVAESLLRSVNLPILLIPTREGAA